MLDAAASSWANYKLSAVSTLCAAQRNLTSSETLMQPQRQLAVATFNWESKLGTRF